MQPMSRKCAHFTDSVIRRMTRIAIANNAINLAQGFPDFDPPKAMLDRLNEVCYQGPHQYPITMGAPNFREALARKCGFSEEGRSPRYIRINGVWEDHIHMVRLNEEGE